MDKHEFNNVTKELATPMSKDELTAAMSMIDVDGSGDIDYFEFKHWYRTTITVPRHAHLYLPLLRHLHSPYGSFTPYLLGMNYNTRTLLVVLEWQSWLQLSKEGRWYWISWE